jgi:hypothetical protein
VAPSTLFLDVIAMGVHVVLTVEEARWRAIGAAMILAPLLEAREWATGLAF